MILTARSSAELAQIGTQNLLAESPHGGYGVRLLSFVIYPVQADTASQGQPTGCCCGLQVWRAIKTIGAPGSVEVIVVGAQTRTRRKVIECARGTPVAETPETHIKNTETPVQQKQTRRPVPAVCRWDSRGFDILMYNTTVSLYRIFTKSAFDSRLALPWKPVLLWPTRYGRLYSRPTPRTVRSAV